MALPWRRRRQARSRSEHRPPCRGSPALGCEQRTACEAGRAARFAWYRECELDLARRSRAGCPVCANSGHSPTHSDSPDLTPLNRGSRCLRKLSGWRAVWKFRVVYKCDHQTPLWNHDDVFAQSAPCAECVRVQTIPMHPPKVAISEAFTNPVVSEYEVVLCLTQSAGMICVPFQFPPRRKRYPNLAISRAVRRK